MKTILQYMAEICQGGIKMADIFTEAGTLWIIQTRTEKKKKKL